MSVTIQHSKLVNGLHYEILTEDNEQFLFIVHTSSNHTVLQYNQVHCKNVTKLIKFCDIRLRQIDWNVPQKELTNKHYDITKNLSGLIRFTHYEKFFNLPNVYR